MDFLFWSRVASLLMFLVVALGAFGAHALKARLTPDMLAIFETGVRYQAYHALGIFAALFLSERFNARYAPHAAACFAVGILIFSGSLYSLALTGVRKFGMITPLGGLLFLAGWALLAASSYRQ